MKKQPFIAFMAAYGYDHPYACRIIFPEDETSSMSFATKTFALSHIDTLREIGYLGQNQAETLQSMVLDSTLPNDGPHLDELMSVVNQTLRNLALESCSVSDADRGIIRGDKP